MTHATDTGPACSCPVSATAAVDRSGFRSIDCGAVGLLATSKLCPTPRQYNASICTRAPDHGPNVINHHISVCEKFRCILKYVSRLSRDNFDCTTLRNFPRLHAIATIDDIFNHFASESAKLRRRFDCRDVCLIFSGCMRETRMKILLISSLTGSTGNEATCRRLANSWSNAGGCDVVCVDSNEVSTSTQRMYNATNRLQWREYSPSSGLMCLQESTAAVVSRMIQSGVDVVVAVHAYRSGRLITTAPSRVPVIIVLSGE